MKWMHFQGNYPPLAITKGKYLRKHTLIRKTASKNILMFFDKYEQVVDMCLIQHIDSYWQGELPIKQHFSSQKCFEIYFDKYEQVVWARSFQQN